MITYINERLNQWVEWRLSGRHIKGLGYPSCANFYRLAPLPTDRVVVPIPNEACYEIDQAVCWLKKHHSNLFEVVMQFYDHAGTAQSHAKALRISERTLYNRLHQAHVLIMEYLQDMDDGVLTCSDKTGISMAV